MTPSTSTDSTPDRLIAQFQVAHLTVPTDWVFVLSTVPEAYLAVAVMALVGISFQF